MKKGIHSTLVFVLFLIFSNGIKSSTVDTLEINLLLNKGIEIFDNNPDSSYYYWRKTQKEIIRKIARLSIYNKTDRNIYLGLFARTYTLVGRFYRNKGDAKKAINQYHKSLAILQVVNDTLAMASNFNNLGIIYQSNLRDDKKAIETFKKAIELIEITGKFNDIDIMYANLGYIYENRDEFDLAFENLYKSIELSKAQGGSIGQSYANYRLGSLHQKIGNLDSAFYYLNKSLIIRQKSNDIRGSSISNYMLSKLFFEKGDIAAAEIYALRAMELAEKVYFPKNMLDSYQILFSIYEKKKNWDKAFKYMKRFNALKDSVDKNNYENEILKIQLQKEYDLKLLSDSLKFENKNKEKELIISNQNKVIRVNNQLRIVYIVIIALIIFLSFLLFRRLQYKKQKKELELQLKIIETEQVLKRALMNPHFLFNSLNSIQNLILNNQNKIARIYIVKISKLMRLILDQSEKQTICLREEIETINLYFEMEQLRFKDKFNYEIHVDESLQLNNTIIPALIIQPFIENSIMHGIQNLVDRQGSIQVHLLNGIDFLYCEIIDNGVGLHQSYNLNDKYYTHNSFGIKSVSERLKNMTYLSKKHVEFVHVYERKDQTGTVIGTTASIKIPFIKSL